MIKRSHFTSRTLAYLLITPQILVTLTFFYWPAAQGLLQSVMLSDPFGQRSRFVWFYNFINIFTDPLYLKSIGITLGLQPGHRRHQHRFRPVYRLAGQPGPAGQGPDPHHADLALRRGTGYFGHPLAVSAAPLLRRVGLFSPEQDGHRLEPGAQRHRRA